MSPRNVRRLLAANLIAAVGGALAAPLDLAPSRETTSVASTSETSTAESDSASYRASTSTWLPDLYVSPPTQTASPPEGGGLYVDVDNENFLVSVSMNSNPNAPPPIPSIVLVATTSVPPILQLPVATQSPTSDASSQVTETSTVFSTVWVTAEPESTVVTSTVSPSASGATSSPTSTGSSPPSSETGKGQAILATYYPDWSSDDLLPEQVDFGRFDWVDFAFAVPTSAFGLAFTQDNSVALLQRLVKSAHSSNPSKRVKLSIGGWTGSKYFSQAVSTPGNTAIFVNNIKNAVSTYGVDGVDLDWEYPGVQGAGDNAISPSDTANFLNFLQQLRSTLGPSKLITAAVSTSPFYLPSSNSTSATSIFNSFGRVLDYITIMNYDVHDNAGSSPGSNAPLLSHGPSCPSAQDVASAELAIDQWTKAGFPVEKILLGVPSYGYAVTSTATVLGGTPDRRRRSISMRKHWSARRRLPHHSPHQRRQDQVASPPNTKAMLAALAPGPVIFNGQQSTPAVSSTSNINLVAAGSDASKVANVVTDGSGQVQFRYLVQVGALVKNTTSTSSPPASGQGGNSTTASSGKPSTPPSFTGSGSYTRYWEQCSSTPYLVSRSQKKVIPYDDPESLQLKARYVMQRGLAGVNMFDIHGDTLDWVLTDALRTGLEQPGPPITN